MIEKKINIDSIASIRRVAEELLAFCDGVKCIAFTGEIGAGKTTLITALCKILEISDVASSPTFSIVNPYEGKKHSVYHMDLYRLNDIEEALGIGIEEYLDSPNYCFIEWPEIIEPLLIGFPIVKVSINVIDETEREFTFSK
jgi:tRNA threonylcarbamoyladenosine biosynthesis protein TsaE